MTLQVIPCVVCGTSAQRGSHSDQRFGRLVDLIYPRCGEYSLPMGGGSALRNLHSGQKAKVSGYLRDGFDLGETPLLTEDTIDRLVALPDKRIVDKLDRLLRWGAKKQEGLHGGFSLDEAPEIISLTHSRDIQEVRMLANFLSDRGFFTVLGVGGRYQVTPYGFIEIDKTEANPVSRSAFIAMWFDGTMDEVRNDGLMPAVRRAGFEPILVNRVEHINRIDDEIISQIRKSRFVVADFTGHRGGVYFEAGFAMGLGLPVFWTCRQTDLPNLHFDIRQYNCIDWTAPAELATRLQTRIEAIIGRGPVPQ